MKWLFIASCSFAQRRAQRACYFARSIAMTPLRACYFSIARWQLIARTVVSHEPSRRSNHRARTFALWQQGGRRESFLSLENRRHRAWTFALRQQGGSHSNRSRKAKKQSFAMICDKRGVFKWYGLAMGLLPTFIAMKGKERGLSNDMGLLPTFASYFHHDERKAVRWECLIWKKWDCPIWRKSDLEEVESIYIFKN